MPVRWMVFECFSLSEIPIVQNRQTSCSCVKRMTSDYCQLAKVHPEMQRRTFRTPHVSTASDLKTQNFLSSCVSMLDCAKFMFQHVGCKSSRSIWNHCKWPSRTEDDSGGYAPENHYHFELGCFAQLQVNAVCSLSQSSEMSRSMLFLESILAEMLRRMQTEGA